MLSFTRALLNVRREHPTLRSGALQLLYTPSDVLAWRRGAHHETWLNLGATPQAAPFDGDILTETHTGACARNVLSPRAGVVIAVEPERTRRGELRGAP